jgi:hypothetical protein
MKAPSVILSTLAMFLIGYEISVAYPHTCAKLPFGVYATETECTPVFLYALAYLTFEKGFAIFFGTRIRGVHSVQMQGSLYSNRFLRDSTLINFIGRVLNFVYLYKLLKKYQGLKFIVSYTRVQSRITGYVCEMYMPVCFRAPLFGLFSYLYDVKINEATRTYT